MAWHMSHTGHQRLSDGSILRLDAERGAYVASWYHADLSMKAYGFGSFDAMRDLVGDWADAFEASVTSALSVAGSGAVLGDQPPVQPPNNLGRARETA